MILPPAVQLSVAVGIILVFVEHYMLDSEIRFFTASRLRIYGSIWISLDRGNSLVETVQ